MKPKPLRLVLSAEQTAAILESGIRFAIIHPGSWPENPGRWVVDLFEVSVATANAAAGVAMGTHRAVKKTTPSKP